ncbi:hypothetical protein Arub01_21680 [Actinomadura rubrobrunea]|uniref:Questin oxidase family protein n=2 Tax=Actinomadura rubrobrunea TaxID=115335 RepID=A0A9W6PVN9_9ACTN|nr:hypothetical protein Arub01_21680 [Actinomadura rubrobrunea]
MPQAAGADPARYATAMDDALERLWDVGFEFGPDFAAHAPMTAEALATLDHPDEVPSWIELNRRRRRYYAPPSPVEPIPEDDPAARRAALGDYRRVADWVAYFDRRLAEGPWQDVVVEWWPVLLDGAFAAFTHGLIRTAHAVRTLRTVPRPSPLQLNELARGLAYWAARYTPLGVPAGPRRGAVTAAEQVPAALSELTAANAGRYAERAPRPPVPAVHAITAPAAIRLVLPILPDGLWVRSYATAEALAARVWAAAPGGGSAPGRSRPAGDPAPMDELVADAVEIGEEHAIKLAEACLREHALRPDERYAAAAHTLNVNCRHTGGF